jgi:hypothetical protein
MIYDLLILARYAGPPFIVVVGCINLYIYYLWERENWN